MADYKQTDIVGAQWNRFSRIVIDNPYNNAPTVICVEQEVVTRDNKDSIVRDIGNLSFPFDPEFIFDIINPTTNEPTGATAAGATVYALVYSYVMAEAAKRDTALEPDIVEEGILS